MNDCIIGYLFVSLSIFYFLMKSRQEILALLRDFKVRKGKKYGILKMGIFGSVARDQQTESSDVDIYYEGEAQGLFSLSHLKNELEELLGSPVDIIRLRDRMNQLLRKRIEREGIYVCTELALDTLSQIKDTLSMIMARTSHIHKVDDFYMNESGMILLDSVCMKLVAVGEAIKNLDKITNKELLLKYPAVNWKDIKGMRDIIVHHYFDIDASVILYSLQKEVPDLYSTICVMLRDLSR